MESREYDVAIVGGGIIGLSTAMHLAGRFPGWRVAVLEKEKELATHQTGHNSGVIHSGIYYRPGSHKARFCVAGVKKLLQFCDENEIEYEQCGKVIVATDESELGRLEALYERGVANGVGGLEMVGPERLKEIEPHAAGVKALWSPQTGIANYTKVSQTYATRFQEAGGDIFNEAPVQSINRAGGSLALETPKGTVQAKHIINCAGLYADRVAAMTEDRVDVRIIPFRGEYFTLRPESHHLVSGLIYPVPDPRFPFLGVHYTRNITGSVEAGPNAVLALSREGYRKRDIDLGETWSSLSYPGFWKMALKNWKIGLGEVHRSYRKSVFLRDLQRLLPEIKETDLAPGGSGVRAQAVARDGSLLDDFSIIQGREAVHVLNAPSPGATSSLAIGEYIVDLAAEAFGTE
jgi:L-2-hydroxyglutarate oxidase